jgi:hypothetical protein
MKIHLIGTMRGKKNRLLVILFVVFYLVEYGYCQVIPYIKNNTKEVIYKSIVGGDVKIEIGLNGVDPALVTVKCASNPYLTKMNDSIYLVRFVQKLDEVKIKLYYKNLPVAIKTYNITDLPLPSYFIDGSNIDLKKSLALKSHNYELKWDKDLEIDPNSLRLYSARVTVTDSNKPNMFFQMRQIDMSQQVFALLPSISKSGLITISDISFLTTYGTVINVTGSWTFNIVD